MKGYSEACWFLDLPGGDHRLYTCTYIPRDPTAPAVVIVPPMGRERLRCYRELANMARDLAAAGHPVARFDYRGEGESSGSFETSTVADRVQDVAAVARALADASGVDEICLVGLRLGALVAVMAAPDIGARQLVLVDPVCKPAGLARTLLRANVVLQTHYQGKISRDAATLREAMASGEAVSIYGFMLGEPLLKELEALDPAPHLARFRGRADLLYMAPREVKPKRDLAAWLTQLEQGAEAGARCVVMAFSWTSRKRWTPRLAPLNAAVRHCLSGGA